jgi:hypothetical protein
MIEENVKQILINRTNPEGLKPEYVNDLIVTHSDNEFFITFSQIERPALLSEEELDKLATIDAIAQSKIVVTPTFIKRMLEVLTENYKKYLIKNNIESVDK